MAVIAQQLGRLAKHSAIYGLGAVVSRLIGVLLLPIVTRYLTPADVGAVDTLISLTVVLVILLRMGISMAFFRFYFDAEDEAGRTTVVRTSFWFTMVMATFGVVVGSLLASEISQLQFATDSRANLVRAALVLLWAQMNYEQLTSLFRVEERSTAFVVASVANVLITVGPLCSPTTSSTVMPTVISTLATLASRNEVERSSTRKSEVSCS